MNVKRSVLRYSLTFLLLLATSALATACAPSTTPTPTPVSKAVGMTATSAPTSTSTNASATMPLPTSTPLPLKALRPTKRVVSIKVEGTIAHFMDKSFWDEAQFTAIMTRKAEFESDRIERLRKVLSKYGVKGTGYVIEFDEAGKTTSLKCDVSGAISKKGNSYYGRFGWLIRPFGLDFIDNHFKESKEGLSWQGVIDGVPTSIVCEFPSQNVPYSAWGRLIGHCHAHVWWTMAK